MNGFDHERRASFALLASAPSPIYPLWRERWGFGLAVVVLAIPEPHTWRAGGLAWLRQRVRDSREFLASVPAIHLAGSRVDVQRNPPRHPSGPRAEPPATTIAHLKGFEHASNHRARP